MKMARKQYIAYINYLVKALGESREYFFNGCGSSGDNSLMGFFVRRLRLPEKYQFIFRDACLWHDVAANAGGTDEHHGWANDELFWLMCRDAVRTKNLRAFRWAALSWAGIKVGYYTLEVGWYKCKHPLSLASMLDVAAELRKRKHEG